MPWSDGLTPATAAYQIASSQNQRVRWLQALALENHLQ